MTCNDDDDIIILDTNLQSLVISNKETPNMNLEVSERHACNIQGVSKKVSIENF